jgi:F-type H+-transporting ATPase subunit gamma
VPGGQERALRRRIKSVQSTKKITRAMELISASRIAKAQQRVAAARPYSEQITAVIRNLSAAGAGAGQPLLTPRETTANVGVVVLTADRGLAGGYNSAVLKLADQSLRDAEASGLGTKVYVGGRKGVSYFRYRDREIASSYIGFSDAPTYENAREIAGEIVAAYEAGEVDRIELVYTEFLTAGTQVPVVKRFVPLEAEDIPDKTEAPAGPQAEYEFEPSPDAILERLLPRYVESRLFAALLDAAASEHAARQRAMKSATDNAGELIKRLDRQMNRARQDSITTEIIEIASGAEALNQMSDNLVGASQSRDFFPEHDIDPFDLHHKHPQQQRHPHH